MVALELTLMEILLIFVESVPEGYIDVGFAYPSNLPFSGGHLNTWKYPKGDRGPAKLDFYGKFPLNFECLYLIMP